MRASINLLIVNGKLFRFCCRSIAAIGIVLSRIVINSLITVLITGGSMLVSFLVSISCQLIRWRLCWSFKRMQRTIELFLVSAFIFFINTGQATALLDVSIANATSEVLSFEQTIQSALQHDTWLVVNRFQQQGVEASSQAANSLPDPRLSIGLANLPTDNFNFSQDAMSQLTIGIKQRFPRGDSLAIKAQQLRIESQAYPLQRAARRAQVKVTVGNLWLDIFKVQQSIALIEKNHTLFAQLIDIVQASYVSALGSTRQYDIVRAQLELTRLEERLDKLSQQKSHFTGQLLPWLTDFSQAASNQYRFSPDWQLTSIMPELTLRHAALLYADTWLLPEQLVNYFAHHPEVMVFDKKIAASETGIRLAKQAYKPEWGINAGYAYRDKDNNGNSRSDLFSIGVSFDLPLFGRQRQDQQLRSVVSHTQAIKTDKLLLLKQFVAAYVSAKGRLQRLTDRKKLYRSSLLPQTQAQAEASLTAYTNDNGDFSEVVRARIAMLTAELDQLELMVEEQKIILGLNYLFSGSENQSPMSNKVLVEHQPIALLTQEHNNE